MAHCNDATVAQYAQTLTKCNGDDQNDDIVRQKADRIMKLQASSEQPDLQHITAATTNTTTTPAAVAAASSK